VRLQEAIEGNERERTTDVQRRKDGSGSAKAPAAAAAAWFRDSTKNLWAGGGGGGARTQYGKASFSKKRARSVFGN
jgi:hypothetical protein